MTERHICPDGWTIHRPPLVDENGFIWHVTWGENFIDLRRRYGPPKPFTLHERWSQRINWRLADLVGWFGHRVAKLSDWLQHHEWSIKRLEDRLQGYDDL